MSILGSRAGLEPERGGTLYLPRNPDPGFTPGSPPGFGPDSESTSVAVGHNRSDRTSRFHLSSVVVGPAGSSLLSESSGVPQNCDAAVRPRSAPPNRTSCLSTVTIQPESVVSKVLQAIGSLPTGTIVPSTRLPMADRVATTPSYGFSFLVKRISYFAYDDAAYSFRPALHERRATKCGAVDWRLR